MLWVLPTSIVIVLSLWTIPFGDADLNVCPEVSGDFSTLTSKVWVVRLVILWSLPLVGSVERGYECCVFLLSNSHSNVIELSTIRTLSP